MTNLAEKSLSELALLYNTMVPVHLHIKKFSDKQTAISRIEKLQNQKGQKPQPIKPITIQHKEKRMKDLEKKIHILVPANPRRAGTAGWHNFNLYKDGMALSDFKAAGGKSNHMSWDLEHKYIELK